jgi:CubicO group peptidase (beta-lactamase class C family)
MAFASSLALLAACSSVPSSEDSSENVQKQSQRLSATQAAQLAHPEYDLNTPAASWWMHSANVAIIDAKIAQGFRLLSLDVVSESPLLFSAAFVENTGDYARAGGGWNSALTEAQLLAIKTDVTRRVVSVAPYRVNGTRMYAAAWMGNTGSQQRAWDLVLHETQANFQTAVTNFSGRVIDLSAQQSQNCVGTTCTPIANQYEVTAVLLKAPVGSADYRQQWLGVGNPKAIGALVTGNDARVADLDSPFGSDQFVYVIEKVANPAVGEQSWWMADLYVDDPDNRAHPYTVSHAVARLGGRYGKLRGYATASGTRYAGVLYDTGSPTPKGTDNVGNAVLNSIDSGVQAILKKHGIPGAALAIVQNGRLVHAKGYGYSNLQQMRQAEPTDLFRLASVSKAVAFSPIMRLIQEGKLSLDTHPFTAFFGYTASLPGAMDDLGDITVRQLMEHSAGLDPAFNSDPSSPDLWKSIEQTRRAASQSTFAPIPGGGTWEYRNTHYQILKYVVEAASGMPYFSYLQQKILAPLGVKRIRVPHLVTEPDVDGLTQAIPYDRPQPYCPFWVPPVTTPLGSPVPPNVDGMLNDASRQASGSLAASPIDLLRWATSLDGSHPGPRSVDAAHWAWVDTDTTRWLPGRRLTFNDGGNNISHNGYIPGDTWAEVVIHSNGIKYAFMSNSEDLGCGADRTHGKDNFRNDMRNLLDTTLTNVANVLPNRDLFDTYIQPPCLPDFHGLPAADFQACFDYWTSLDRFPVTLTATPNGQFMSGSFQQVPNRLTRHLIGETDYASLTVAQSALGVLPNKMNIIQPTAGQSLFTGTWTPVNGYGETYHSMTLSDYVTRWNNNYTAGLLNTDVFPYYDGTQLRVLATWRQVPQDGYATWIELTDADFQTKDTQYRASGLKLTHFTSYRNAGQLRHAAIWEKMGGEWKLTQHTTGADYQTKYNELTPQGFALHQLHSYDADSYDVIWKRLPAGQPILGFESSNGFTLATGSATLGTSNVTSQGYGALSVTGGGFIEVRSPVLSAADIRASSPSGAPTSAVFDLFIPTSQPNPAWIGGAQFYMDIPSAGINHLYIGQVELTPLPRGRYTPLSFTLPQSVRTALAGNAADVRFGIALNINAGTPAYLIDHLRFL